MKLILILAGILNKQNCRIWGTENSHAYIEKPTHSKRVIVCCGFWYRGIIGPFLWKYTWKGQWSMAVVIGLWWTNFCSQKLKRTILAIFGFNRVALRATAKATPDVLHPVFENHIISRRADVVWPSRSCDLIPLDCYRRVPSKISVTPTRQRQLTL